MYIHIKLLKKIYAFNLLNYFTINAKHTDTKITPYEIYTLQRLKATGMLNDGMVNVLKYYVHVLNALEMATIRMSYKNSG